MPILFANLWQMKNIGIMCGMSNSSVVPKIKYVTSGVPELLVTNISISSKNRMTISILLMKFNLYGLVIAWIQEAPAIYAPSSSDVCESKHDGDLGTRTVSIF